MFYQLIKNLVYWDLQNNANSIVVGLILTLHIYLEVVSIKKSNHNGEFDNEHFFVDVSKDSFLHDLVEKSVSAYTR